MRADHQSQLEYARAYREKNKEAMAEYQKAYRQTHKLALQAHKTAWRRKNPEKANACNKAYRDNNPRKALAWRVKWMYGLTLDRLDALGKHCHICDVLLTKRGKTRRSIDHDHETGEVRGLLCQRCNIGLGHFNDDAALLSRAVEYLATSQRPRKSA